MPKILEALDHPLPFVFFLTLAVLGMAAFMTWAAKGLRSNGLAAVTQH